MAEIMCKHDVISIKMIEQSDSTLRHSTFDILQFCGSLFKFVKFHTRFRCQVSKVLNPDTRHLIPDTASRILQHAVG